MFVVCVCMCAYSCVRVRVHVFMCAFIYGCMLGDMKYIVCRSQVSAWSASTYIMLPS